MMTCTRNSSAPGSFGVAQTAPPITDHGVARAFVRMLSAAVESGDYAESLKITRGAEVHFAFLAAEAGR